MLKNAIVMDVDQVLLDYAGRLREFVNVKHGKAITGHSVDWDLTKWLGLRNESEMYNVINDFSRSYEFGTLDSFPGADVILHNLMKEGYSLVAVTACGTSDITTSLRKVNMFHRFGDIFDEVHFVEFSESKVEKLRDIASRYNIVSFVDDKPSNLIDASYGAGINNCILMKAPHNRSFRENSCLEIDYAFGWYECANLIAGYEVTPTRQTALV